MKVIIQEEKTGCGIASVANIVNLTYAEVKKKANSIGIFAEDDTLYSDTKHVRHLLAEFNVETACKETSFTTWDELPDLALLSLKYHLENGVPYWHWVVFKRTNGNPVVCDSASYLDNNARIDFEAMKPAWFIEISKTSPGLQPKNTFQI